ncbi:PHR domain protein [Teladorsagia circumcincta]|uniref:PHR domain protein n=1 Tax=Teladorsagia circumcincta TaxID=45464 RepID=A0A2G9V1V8_TELCI|nr:PHR domain protein [Teladorsagia circumcincta]
MDCTARVPYALLINPVGNLFTELHLCGCDHLERTAVEREGWGYSAHSIEAIQVKASKDVRLLGIGLYGGRGEYIAKIKLFRLPSDMSDEQCAEMLSESDETLYDCGQREAAALMLAQPVLMKANHWHVVSAKIR